MKSILIIGLGRFGTHLIHRFYDLGDEVMAVDISEEKVQEAMPFVTSAKIGDCTKLDTLRTLGTVSYTHLLTSMPLILLFPEIKESTALMSIDVYKRQFQASLEYRALYSLRF